MKYLRYISRYMLYPSLCFGVWITIRKWLPLPRNGKLDLFVAAVALIVGAWIAHNQNDFDAMEQEEKKRRKEQDLLVWVDVPIEEQEQKDGAVQKPKQK